MAAPLPPDRFERRAVISGIGQSEVGRRIYRDPLDLTVDCSGAGAAIGGALKVTKGRVLCFGVPHGLVDFGVSEWRSGVRLEGYGGRLRAGADLARHLLATRQIDESLYITATLPFERYAHAVDLLRRKEAIKVCFLPSLVE